MRRFLGWLRRPSSLGKWLVGNVSALLVLASAGVSSVAAFHVHLDLGLVVVAVWLAAIGSDRAWKLYGGTG